MGWSLTNEGKYKTRIHCSNRNKWPVTRGQIYLSIIWIIGEMLLNVSLVTCKPRVGKTDS